MGKLTEFAWMDVEAVHLVKSPANGTELLLAKSAEPSSKPESSPSSSRKSKKKMSKNKKMAKRLLKECVATDSSTPPMDLGAALSTMKAAADVADEQGDANRAMGIRREIAVIKMQAAERARSRNGVSYSRMGPNSAELFPGGTGTLPEDSSMRYV